MKQYPFRFYGREPADWTLSNEGFLYDVQFAKAVNAEVREAVRALAERQFSRGPAGVGEVWSWGGDRFLVFAVRPRVDDAARMIFTQVAEFLSVLHQTARLRDVVFCNGYGARADRWDAWTLAQSPLPDPGPARPDAPWAKHLRRPELPELSYAAAAAPRRRDAKPAPPPPSAAQPATERAPRKAQTSSAVYRTGVDALPVSEAEELAVAGWQQLAAGFPEAELARIEGPSIPIGWVREEGRNVAVVCFNAQGVPQRIELPDGGGAQRLAVDPDGLVAVTHRGNTIYSIDVPAGTIRSRLSIHENNGPVSAIAWAADDLWAVRVTSQLMFFDLSEKDHVYVGTQQPQGVLAGIFRHGTIAALDDGATLRFVGVCDWQFKELASMGVSGASLRVIDDALYLTERGKVSRIEGIDEVYEAWAAPLRRRAEQDRTRRMQPPEEGIRWRATTEAEMPPDDEKIRRDALVAKYGEEAWVHVHEGGDAVIALPKKNHAVSRGAKLRWCPAKGRARLFQSPRAASNFGVTCFSMDLARESLFFVAGSTFGVYRVDLATDVTQSCHLPGFSVRPGLLYDIVALDRQNLLSIWNDTLDWHRPEKGQWLTHTQRALDLPRGNALHRPTRRLVISQQSRERLVVLHLGEDGFAPLASCTDAVKLMGFREGRLFAQMIDGQWFELLGIDAPTAPSATRSARP
jgi:hypothetical protein